MILLRIYEIEMEIKAIGGEDIVKAKVVFYKHDTDLIVKIENPNNSLLDWMFALGEYSVCQKDVDKVQGSLKYNKRLYDLQFCKR